MGFDPGESRDEGGRWTSGGGAGKTARAKLAERAKDVAKAGTVAGSTAGPARGADLTHSPAFLDSLADVGNSDTEELLRRAQHAQGFGATPAVGSRAEVDKAVAGGAVELWRGIDGVTPEEAAQRAEQFRTGDLFIGQGTYGPGTYTTPDKSLATRFATDMGMSGQVLRMALRPDAKVITRDELYQHMLRDNTERTAALLDIRQRMRELPDGDEAGFDALSKESRALSGQSGQVEKLQLQPGVYAAAAGYDAVRIDRPNHEGGTTTEMLLLNRTAVLVEKARR